MEVKMKFRNTDNDKQHPKWTRNAAFAAIALFIALAAVVSAFGQSGALKVTSFPTGASVSVDGVDTGKVTPMSISLAIGDHHVIVSIPNSGWKADDRHVDVVSGNNDLSITLLPTLTTGPQGPKGDKGDTGGQGIQGLQGLKGDKGDKGDTGSQGIQGVKGDKGDTGATGLQGIQGTKGDKGDMGIQGIQGVKGDKGDTGQQGPTGITPQEITTIQQQINTLQTQVTAVQQSGGGFSGIQAFTNSSNDGSTTTYSWTAPAGITHVMVEMWGGGGGGGFLFGGAGGAYSRSVVSVTPGSVYTIKVGGGGLSLVVGQRSETSGSNSSMSFGPTNLIVAGGGFTGGIGGAIFSSIGTIKGDSGTTDGPAGAAAFGASFCPNGDQTGHGGGAFGGGNPGYVLLVW
jgi:hypothetical protein